MSSSFWVTESHFSPGRCGLGWIVGQHITELRSKFDEAVVAHEGLLRVDWLWKWRLFQVREIPLHHLLVNVVAGIAQQGVIAAAAVQNVAARERVAPQLIAPALAVAVAKWPASHTVPSANPMRSTPPYDDPFPYCMVKRSAPPLRLGYV